MSESVATLDRVMLAQRGRRLEYFTILWNSLEGLVALGTGLLAGSMSLMGFGIDSFIEVSSGSVLLWRMSVDADACQRTRRERVALRLVGVSFVVLAVYFSVEATWDHLARRAPETSRLGITVA